MRTPARIRAAALLALLVACDCESETVETSAEPASPGEEAAPAEATPGGGPLPEGAPLAEAWRYASRGEANAHPAPDGLVHVAPHGVVRRDGAGEARWRHEARVRSDATVRLQRAGELLLFDHGEQAHVALALEDGAVRWERGDWLEAQPAGAALVAREGCALRLVDPASGEPSGPRFEGERYVRPPIGESVPETERCRGMPQVLGRLGGRAFVAEGSDAGSAIVAVEAGEERWRASLPGGPQAIRWTPWGEGAVAWSVAPDGLHLLAIDGQGARRWERAFGAERCAPGPAESALRVFEGDLVLERCGRLARWDADGEARWEREASLPSRLAGERREGLFARVSAGQPARPIATVDPASGEERARWGGCSECSVYLLEDGFLVATEGAVEAVGAEGGPRWRWEVDATPRIAGELVLLTDDAGRVRVLEGSSGRL
ncbi:MAG: hypothetical protein CMH59_20660, partial [Myxococcales bacterium]|nr:hypothetical protein [Myxococcales bacterium]